MAIKEYNFDPVRLFTAGGKEYFFINKEVAEDFMNDLSDLISGRSGEDVELKEGEDYEMEYIKVYATSSAALSWTEDV